MGLFDCLVLTFSPQELGFGLLTAESNNSLRNILTSLLWLVRQWVINPSSLPLNQILSVVGRCCVISLSWSFNFVLRPLVPDKLLVILLEWDCYENLLQYLITNLIPISVTNCLESDLGSFRLKYIRPLLSFSTFLISPFPPPSLSLFLSFSRVFLLSSCFCFVLCFCFSHSSPLSLVGRVFRLAHG